jgi:hypothetical protein
MSLQRGEDCVIGIAQSTDRQTHADAQVWIPARTPSGIAPQIESIDVKEARGNKVTSTGREIVQKRVEGDLEINVRVQSIGHLLKPFFGAVASVVNADPSGLVYDHTFTILADTPVHPAIHGSLSQPAGQDYEFIGGGISKLDLTIDPGDLVRAVAGLGFSREVANAGGAYVPSFSPNDSHFRHQDVVIKLAANVAGLDAAPAIGVKSFATSLPNGLFVNQNVSELNGQMLVGAFDLSGSFELDYQNEALHDAFDQNTYQAMRVEMVRSDITLGNGENPRIAFIFPKISINGWTPNRPLEEIVTQAISFMAHNDPTEGAIKAEVRNLVANYNPA